MIITMLKMLILLTFFLFSTIPCISEATEQSDAYTNMIRNGKYHIICRINSDFNRNDGSDKGHYQDVTLFKDEERGIEYFSLYGHEDGSKYYYWIELLQYKKQYYAQFHGAKKELDIEGEKQKKLKEIEQTHFTYWPYYGTPKAKAISKLFSCLGDITAKNNILKNYKAEYKDSGEFEQDGEKYKYDEYIITYSEQAKLQLQYLDGKLAYSIKFTDDNMVSHPMIFASTLKEDRIDAIMFEKFDDDTDSFVKSLISRISKKETEK